MDTSLEECEWQHDEIESNEDSAYYYRHKEVSNTINIIVEGFESFTILDTDPVGHEEESEDVKRIHQENHTSIIIVKLICWHCFDYAVVVKALSHSTH